MGHIWGTFELVVHVVFKAIWGSFDTLPPRSTSVVTKLNIDIPSGL